MSTTWYKLTSVLPLPYEIREKIYDDLEPNITITPQYPVNIRMAIEPGWSPGYELHPMHGINDIMNEEIKSRYYNTDDTAQTSFIPKKTTFRIWHRHCPLMKMHMNAFLNKNDNNSGVRHLEYIIDSYDCSPEADERFFLTLARFPLLDTLKVVLNYRSGSTNWQSADFARTWLTWQLDYAFPRENSKMEKKWQCTKSKRESAKWEIQEFCILEDEE